MGEWRVVVLVGLFCLRVILIAAVRTAGSVTEPKFNTAPEEVKVTVDARAVLPCSVESLGDYSVIWVNPRKILLSHNDRRVIDDPRVSVERPYVREWNLLIRGARLNDSGSYECRINTKPSQIKKVSLVVQVPPVVISELSSDREVLREGDTATLVCNVTGVPPPDVTWYKRNTQHRDSKKERIGEEGSVLVISNITRACDDIYECHVDNGVPPAVTKTIRVVVEYPPEVYLPTKRIGQSLGRETILDCVISAVPQAVNEWRRDGQLVRKSEKHEVVVFSGERRDAVTLSLRIKRLDKDDYGRYVCVGSNHLGQDEQEMVLYEIITSSTTTTTTTRPTTTTILFSTTPWNRQRLEYPFGPNGQVLADGHVFHSSSPHHGRDKSLPGAIMEESRPSASKGHHTPFCRLLHILTLSFIMSFMLLMTGM